MIKSKKDFDSLLRKNGYTIVLNKKHEVWSNGERKISCPRKHSKRFSIYLHERLLKEIGLL